MFKVVFVFGFILLVLFAIRTWMLEQNAYAGMHYTYEMEPEDWHGGRWRDCRCGDGRTDRTPRKASLQIPAVKVDATTLFSIIAGILIFLGLLSGVMAVAKTMNWMWPGSSNNIASSQSDASSSPHVTAHQRW